jgi:hypothetical protein
MLESSTAGFVTAAGLRPLLAQGLGNNTLWLVLLVAALILVLAFFAIFARYFRLWIQSVTTGAGIGILDLLGMSFRKVNPKIIVRRRSWPCRPACTTARGSPPGPWRHITWRGKRAADHSLDDRGPQGKNHRPELRERRRSTWPAAMCWKRCKPVCIRG